MSEDRTLEPSPRRVREARERGQVPSSAELTAAVGLLAAVAALGACGEDLADGVIEAVREAYARWDLAATGPEAFASRLRSAVGGVAGPLAIILAAPALAGMAAHQVQVGGLFLPALALPDPGRLGIGAAGRSLADRLGRAVGATIRAAVLAALAWWAMRSALGQVDATPGEDLGALLTASAAALHAALLKLGLAMLAIGVAHYAMQVRRLDARLRMSPDERREEQRSYEGDPGLRARRRAVRARGMTTSPVPDATAANRI